MGKHLIKIKYNDSIQPAVFMAKAFTRKEIINISNELLKIFDDVYYDELKTTFVCKGYRKMNKIMRYLIDNYNVK